ncbi:hypothetical protein FB451DRAFT_1189749 [Mycena latifolia]|nr:hypothetical protein FB451DRAFT_1189749 [Mycena latifolia]
MHPIYGPWSWSFHTKVRWRSVALLQSGARVALGPMDFYGAHALQEMDGHARNVLNPRWVIEVSSNRGWMLWDPSAEQKGNDRVGLIWMELFLRGKSKSNFLETWELARNVTWYSELAVK